MIPPVHFALSEILIALTSIYSFRYFLKYKFNYASLGVLILGATAFLASIRFGFSLHNELKFIHQLFNTLSLLFGVPLIVIEFIKKNEFFNYKLILISTLIIGIVSIYIFFQAKSLIIFIAVTWLILGIIFSFLIPRKNIIYQFLSGFIFSIILINFLIRQSQFFEPNFGWHFYHIIIAIWLYLMTILLANKNTKYE